MRRDLVITALIFAAIGFLAGLTYTRFADGGAPRISPARPSPSANPEGDLPEGHPPLEVAERWRALEEQAEANPDDAQAALELANFLYDSGRWEQAIRHYQRVLELTPQNTNARTDLGTCYYNLGQYDRAIAEFTRALEIEPNKPQALFNLAMARLQKQDRAGARRAYEQLRRAHPAFEGLDRLGQLLERESIR